MKTQQDFDSWVSKQPRWAQEEIHIMRNRITELTAELDVHTGDKSTRIVYGYDKEARHIPDDRGPVRFTLDGGETISVHIEKVTYVKERQCLHIASGRAAVSIVPQAANCFRVYLFGE